MLILYLVDIHGNSSILDKLGSLDLNVSFVVFGGDITNFGSVNQAIQILEKAYNVLKKPIVFVPGNCDDSDILNWVGKDQIYPVHGKVLEIGGVKIGGIGGSTITPFNTYIEFTESEIKSILDNLKDQDITVLVTHSPPYNTKLDKVYSGNHVGSLEIRKFLELQKPSVVLTGHIHEAPGVDYIGDTPIVNPGPASRGNYALVNLGEKVEIKLKKIT